MKTNTGAITSRSFFFTCLSFAYLFGLIALCNTVLWPTRFWWIANLVSIAPLGFLYVPAAAGLIYGALLKHKIIIVLNSLSVLVIFFGLMGWNVPASTWFQSKQPKNLTVLTVNLGEKARMSSFREYIRLVEPDVILLQESGDWVMKFFKKMPQGQWDTYFHDGFGLISRYKIIDTNVLKGKKLNASGTFMVEYLLEGPHGPFHLFNVHLETPRKGLEPLIIDGPGAYPEMIKVTDTQKNESYRASTAVVKKKNAVVAGDFNLVALNPIFQSYWSKYQDAFSKAGWGFGYTKHTGWHGARIDHILTDRSWQALEVGTGPDLGGDHRPIYARLAFVGEPEEFFQQPVPETVKEDISSKDMYYNEDLESNVSGAGNLTLPLTDWPMEIYPRVRFTYRIPSDVSVVARVLTPFDDWICLGGTDMAECPHAKSNEYFELVNDGEWHDLDMNADRSIKSVLKGLKGIKEWQFFIPGNPQPADEFWIGNFSISK